MTSESTFYAFRWNTPISIILLPCCHFEIFVAGILFTCETSPQTNRRFIEYVRFPSNALAGHSLRGISFVLPVHPLTAFVYIEKESMEIRGKESISLK